MGHTLRTISTLLIAALLSSCSLLSQPTPLPWTPVPLASPTPQLQITTEIPMPELPTVTETPAPTLTPTELVLSPIDATALYDNYLLRGGPGRLFTRLSLYAQGTTVKVLARAPGYDWVFVQTPDYLSGWMNRVGLESITPFSALPLIDVSDFIVLSGHVWNPDKTPANYIGISLQPVGNTNPELMEHVMTGADGAWFAFLPTDTRGEWVVGPDSYGCPPTVPTGQCSLPGSFPAPQTITLPDAAEVSLEFNIIPY